MQNIFDFLLDNAHFNNINKRNLGEALGLENFDTAYPQQWADKVRELQLNPSMCVYSYDEHPSFGAPVDLSKLLFERIIKDLPEFGMRMYLLGKSAKLTND